MGLDALLHFCSNSTFFALTWPCSRKLRSRSLWMETGPNNGSSTTSLNLRMLTKSNYLWQCQGTVKKKSAEAESGSRKIGRQTGFCSTVFRIRIHRIHMFLDLPDPVPLIRGMDPDLAPNPDPSIIKQKLEEKPCFLLFCDFFWTFYLWKMM